MESHTTNCGMGVITVLGEMRAPQDFRVLMVELSQGGCPVALHFDSSRHNVSVLAPALRTLFKDLAGRLVTGPVKNGSTHLNLPFFNQSFGNLHFQTAAVTATHHGNFCPVKIELLETRGSISDLFAGPTKRDYPDFMDDVFLPLTNLAAYLRATEASDAGQHSQKAAELTADRIDEFLLSFGERMKASAPQTQRYKQVG